MKAVGSGKGLQFIRQAIQSNADECIMWPFYRMKNGYGQVGTHVGMSLAHRIVCELTHGDPQFDGAQAAHLCGNKACVNPRHVRWVDQKENEADKLLHGTWFTRFGGAKLTEEEVRAMRDAHKSGESIKTISDRTCVPFSTVRKVIRRDTWKHVR